MSGPHRPHFILASASPRRQQLLAQIGLVPDAIIPADINEDPIAGEQPREHALRLAQEKCAKIASENSGAIILAADTVVGVGRRILPKTETEDEARYCLNLLTGRSHRVFTGVAIMDASGDMRHRVIETRLKMKRLSHQEIESYVASKEWQGKAGGYGIQGYASAFIHHINGSYSNVVGLPLYETRHLLMASGSAI